MRGCRQLVRKRKGSDAQMLDRVSRDTVPWIEIVSVDRVDVIVYHGVISKQ
jgi:hypothetical protein